MARKNTSTPVPDISSAKKRRRASSAVDLDWSGFNGFHLKANKKRKSTKGTPTRNTSFSPVFEGTELTDRSFEVTNAGQHHWNSMPKDRYRKFTIENHIFGIGNFVFIKPDEDQIAGSEDAPIDRWVAKVLEIRASDASHVFIRVFWMFRPEDLPIGRQPYHGYNELIASNAMDILDAMTVEGPANVKHLVEDSEQAYLLDPHQLFWRQTYDITKPKAAQLSELLKYCVDKEPMNPDGILVQCESCKQWSHGRCLEKAALENAYKENDLANSAKGDRKEGTKRKSKGAAVLKAEISATQTGSTHMTVTDLRSRRKDHQRWTVPIKCLSCDATIEDAADEANAATRSATPSDNINIGSKVPSTPSNKDHEDEESVPSVEMSSPEKRSPKLLENPPAPATATEAQGEVTDPAPPSPTSMSA